LQAVARLSLSILGTLALTALLALSLDGPEADAQAPEMKPYEETIPGTSVKFTMVPIPGGTYTIGSPAGEKGHKPDEGPPRQITIQPFWMGKFEVTWSEYDLYAFSLDIKKEGEEAIKAAADKALDGVTRPTPPYTDMTFGYGHDGYPALCMTHHAAIEYCRWLSARTGKGYRLPTEAEWEYACRAGTTTAYSFGDDPAKLDEYAWSADNSDGKPHPVGQKKPNPWGLYDMHGNVAEWTIDHYNKDQYATYPADKPTLEPFLLPTEKRFPHVARGGSWDDDPPLLRSAARKPSNREWLRQDPQRPQSIWWLTEGVFVGFRVIRPVTELDGLKGFKSKVTKQSPYQ
jgi:formylglycine-generating enzyme required for sulfatase activity